MASISGVRPADFCDTGNSRPACRSLPPMSGELSPVFIFSSAGRTGSTLLQRLLISTHEIMIWGEHDGAMVAAASQLLRRLRAWRELTGGPHQQEAFARHGHDAWIPNLTPPIEAFIDGLRALFTESMGAEARRLGYPRWGFKEIRHDGNDALLLKTLFPDARFIYSVRHPADALRSLKSTGWYGLHCGSDPVRFASIWTTSVQSLLQSAPRLGQVLIVRYEDIVADPQVVVDAMATHVGIAPERFDLAAFGRRHRGSSNPPDALSSADRQALAAPELVRTAQLLGYGVTEDTQAG